MPKVLVYIFKKIMWIFLFWNTDVNENRAHVHVGKPNTQHLCKIWLEPCIEVDSNGDLTDAQVKEILEIVAEYHEVLLKQWKDFKEGKAVKMLKVTKKS